MAPWFWYAVVAAVLYGAHQIFTRLASGRIRDGLGALWSTPASDSETKTALLFAGGFCLDARAGRFHLEDRQQCGQSNQHERQRKN